MKVFLTMGRDGRILIQGKLNIQSSIGDILYYLGPGEAFNGIGFDEFAKAVPGVFELPEQPDVATIAPDTQPEGLEPE